ncbi:integrase, catalytic region, zinc finger, CCHC-type containing protein [Tanacetum coccineum]
MTPVTSSFRTRAKTSTFTPFETDLRDLTGNFFTSDQSSSSDIISTIVPPDHQVSEHNSKWTKGHPLENIIGDIARPVSTRLQIYKQALFCYYDAFLTSVEPKSYKDALTQACWIEAMLEELHKIERLEVYENFSSPEKALSSLLKSFSPVARLEAIHLFLAFAAQMNRVSTQMDVKTAFLNGNLREEISMMGKISFFLGLVIDISQIPRGIFINQSKYALESLKKYGFESCDPVDTPMVEKSKLDEDKE